MKVRQPQLDFSDMPTRWARNGEFAQSANASSTAFPHLEPFLNRVMSRARAAIKGDSPADVELRKQISIFIKQESVHYKTHAQYNEILRRGEYPKIPEFEAELAKHYEKILATKSLAFLTAYCEGFEILGPPSAINWLDELEDMVEGADPRAVAMWKWHLMEEYEHRFVAYDVFKRIHGGYFMRIYGMLYQAYHLFSYVAKVNSYILSVDREKMTPEELRVSKINAKVASKRYSNRMFKQFLRGLSPFYRPQINEEPRNYKHFMKNVERMIIAT